MTNRRSRTFGVIHCLVMTVPELCRLVGVGCCVGLLTGVPFAVDAQNVDRCVEKRDASTRVVSSARITRFTSDVAKLGPGSIDRLWKEMTERGTPLVERATTDGGCMTVTFVYRDAAADSVRLISGLSGWLDSLSRLERVAGTDVWYRSALVPYDTRIGYVFRVGRKTRSPELILDSLNTRVDSALGRRSLFAADGAPPATWTDKRANVAHGRVNVVQVRMSGRDTLQTAWVYTPPAYERTPGDTLPLLVLFDGGAYVSSTIVGLPAILDNLIAEQRIVPVAVLFLPQELTPATRQATMGNNTAYAKAVAEEVIPWVQATYRVTRDPRRIVIGGSSLGGLAASHVALHYPQVVGNVLSQSGSYQWGAPGNSDPEWLTTRLGAMPVAPVRFYMEAGTFEVGAPPGVTLTLLGANRRFRDALVAKGYQVSYREVHGGHEYLSWRTTIVEPLQLFFGVHRGSSGKAELNREGREGREARLDSPDRRARHVPLR